MNTIGMSPKLLSSLAGAGQIGDYLVQLLEFGAAGSYEVGTVVSLVNGKIVLTSNNTAGAVYGIIAVERYISDIDSERELTAHVIRRGSFNADGLEVADDTSLTVLAPRMRELGMYLEGLARSIAPPFRLRKIHPTRAEAGTTNLRLDIWVEGSWDDSARIFWDGTIQNSTTVLDFSHAWCTIPLVEGASNPALSKAVKVQVRQGSWQSNEIIFDVAPSTAPPPPLPLTANRR